jgi:hypothetical protein
MTTTGWHLRPHRGFSSSTCRSSSSLLGMPSSSKAQEFSLTFTQGLRSWADCGNGRKWIQSTLAMTMTVEAQKGCPHSDLICGNTTAGSEKP